MMDAALLSPSGPTRDRAARITRGVRRYLRAAGLASLTEFTLRTGRRADILALAADGQFVIIEVKSCLNDFRTDQKWPDYRDFCDRFFFAVDEDFPQEAIPESCGLMVADAFGAEMMRDSPIQALAPARRKALVLGFAQLAATRLHAHEDAGLVVTDGAGRSY